MALGTVNSIDENDNTQGTVLEEETLQIYRYDDPQFGTKGLVVGSKIIYDIDYTQPQPIATNLQKYIPLPIEITTPVTGPLTVNPGETLTVKNGGSVTGTITVNSGNLFVEGTGVVTGDVTVDNQGNLLVRKGGNIKGSVIINNASSFKVVNKGNIKGSVIINAANRFTVGNDNGGGSIQGSITINKIRKVAITATSTINCG